MGNGCQLHMPLCSSCNESKTVLLILYISLIMQPAATYVFVADRVFIAASSDEAPFLNSDLFSLCHVPSGDEPTCPPFQTIGAITIHIYTIAASHSLTTRTQVLAHPTSIVHFSMV